ncbi:MAG: transposase [Actinomycetia bacterium]|nr:transposase [Actinomycetes bacterium]
MVDAPTGQLLDVVEGRTASAPAQWLAGRHPVWLSRIQWAVLDLSGPYRSTFAIMLPDAVQVADPMLHVVQLANRRLDECRRRVQNELLGHRGHKADPLFRARRLLTMAHERLDPVGDEKRRGLLAAGDPKGEVAYAWRYRTRGGPVPSMTSPTPTSLISTWPSRPPISRTTRSHPKCRAWAGP